MYFRKRKMIYKFILVFPTIIKMTKFSFKLSGCVLNIFSLVYYISLLLLIQQNGLSLEAKHHAHLLPYSSNSLKGLKWVPKAAFF